MAKILKDLKPARMTDRTAYLRGLADGMGIKPDTDQNKLMLEMLSVMDEMAQQLGDLDADIGELEEYVEDIDTDLADMEDVLFGDEDEDDDDEDEDDDEDGEFDDDEELSFDCPNCGKTVMVKAADIDFDESPVCEFCGKPFFTDTEEEDDEDGDDE